METRDIQEFILDDEGNLPPLQTPRATAYPLGRLADEDCHTQRCSPWTRRVILMVQALTLLSLGFASGLQMSNVQGRRPELTVNGESVSHRDFIHRCELASGNAVARQMTKELLQLQFAKRLGVLPTAEDVDRKFKQTAMNPASEKLPEESKKSAEDIRRGILLDMAQSNIVGKGVRASEEDVREFYRSNADPKNVFARYTKPESVQVAIIVTRSLNDVQNAIHELASGASFADVASRYSVDTSKVNNGLLSPIRRGQMNPIKYPRLEQTLFSMKIGQQLDDLKIAGSHWIIRCVARQAPATIPFESVRSECEDLARIEKGMRLNGRLLEAETTAFDKAANIQAADPIYGRAVTSR